MPEVNGERALEHDGIVANPNCCTIPLTCVLKPLHEAAGLARVRVATYQSVSGAGAQQMEQLRAEPPAEHNLAMDWAWEGDEIEEESKLAPRRARSWSSPSCRSARRRVRVPVLVGHAEAVWIESTPADAGEAEEILSCRAVACKVVDVPTPSDAAQTDRGARRTDPRRSRRRSHGLVRILACDNSNKGAALNAIQIAELILARALV